MELLIREIRYAIAVRILVYKKGNDLLSYKQYSNAMMRRVGRNVLIQRAPVGGKEQRAYPEANL